MKSFSKIHSPVSSSGLETWNVADLDVESNVYLPDTDIEEIISLFGVDKEKQPSPADRESNLSFPVNGWNGGLANWFPDDLEQPIEENAPAHWDFVNPSNDFLKIPEQQILQEKLEAEKERIELIKQARVEAEAILCAAQLEADKIVMHAQDEIGQAKKEAYMAASKEMQSALAATHAILDETQKWQSSFMESGEQILTGMLKEIAETMFGEGVHLDVNALQINLNRVMESAQRLGDLNIFINPQDANLLDPSWSDYQLLITGNKVRIVPSEKILPGGCFIKGITGAVDARVETQLAAVLNTIDEVSGMGR
jgi:flagellar biosynthesis/type III secretory pathway protein FliH